MPREGKDSALVIVNINSCKLYINLGIPKKRILKSKETYRRIFKCGRFRSAFSLDVISEVSVESPKIGFVVSKKVQGSVNRNFIKRRLREAYRLEQDGLQLSSNLVLIGSERTSKTDFELLRKELRALLKD